MTCPPWLTLSLLVRRTGLRLHLFVNDFTPAKCEARENFHECSSPGYGPIELPAWEVDRDYEFAAHPMVTFPFQGATPPIYGWYIPDPEFVGCVVAAQRFEQAVEIGPEGGFIEVGVRIVPK